VCRDIGYKIAVPPKKGVDAWKRLYTTLRERERRRVVTGEQVRVSRIHELERRVERLSAMSANAGRARTIRELRKRLRETKRNAS
jgi:hypothetical protein